MENEIATPEVDMEMNQDTAEESALVKVDAMDAMIGIASKIEQYEKAMNSVMNFILRQSYAADWISHARESDPVLMRSANLSGAGAERIAKSLGISESHWIRKDKVWSEDHKSYTYECEADFSLGGRTVHAYGRASSKDKFFGYANGQWKEQSDVKEDDIKIAAFRNCRKEGVRTLLGLRKIPIMKLKELGFNIDLVHCINYKSAKDAIADKSGQSGSTEQEAASNDSSENKSKAEKIRTNIIVQQLKVRKWKDTPIIDVVTNDGTIYSWWGKKPENPEVQSLANMMASGWLVAIEYTQKGEYRNFQRVIEGGPQ